jgi:hypothetical protein
MSVKCSFCGALFFAGEMLSKNKTGTFKMCCQHGKVLHPLADNSKPDPFPVELREVMTNSDHHLYEVYHRYCRVINNFFSFCSFECKSFDIVQKGK